MPEVEIESVASVATAQDVLNRLNEATELVQDAQEQLVADVTRALDRLAAHETDPNAHGGQVNGMAFATPDTPGTVMPDGVTTAVDSTGLLSVLGGNLLYNSEEWITESGAWTAPVTGWYDVLIINGGGAGHLSSAVDAEYVNMVSGNAGAMSNLLLYFEQGQQVPCIIGAGTPSLTTIHYISNPPYPWNGGITSFAGQTGTKRGASICQDVEYNAIPVSQYPVVRLSGKGPGGGYPRYPLANDTQEMRNNYCRATGFFGASGACSILRVEELWAAGAGAQGSVRVRWYDQSKAGGPTSVPDIVLNGTRLFASENDYGSVWPTEAVPAKIAEGYLTTEEWLEQIIERNSIAAMILTVGEGELFSMLRTARDAKLSATDYLMTSDYPLTDEQRAAVTAYRQALRDLPSQDGAPWDGGGELTPWPALPAALTVKMD